MILQKHHYQLKRYKTILLLIGIIFFALIVRLIFFSGVGSSDSLTYTEYAYDLTQNKFPTDSTQRNTRIGLIFPVSILYSIFGVNDFISVLFPLITSILGIILIFFVGKFLFNEKIGLISAFLLSIYPLDVLNSTRLFSDLPSAFFTSLSIFLFLIADKNRIKMKAYALYLMSGLSLGISFSIREMAILTLLFFLAYVIYNRKLKLVYAIVGLGFLAILLIEISFFNIYTNDPFFRFNSLSNYNTSPDVTESYYGRSYFPKFFITWPYVIFGNIQLGYFFMFFSLSILYWIFNRKKETNYLMIWFFSFIFYFYFGTTSLSSYAPFLAVDRYLSYITLPGIILLAAFLMKLEKKSKKTIFSFTLVFLFFVSLSSIYLVSGQFNQRVDDLKPVFLISKDFDQPIYTDSRSLKIMSYLSGYETVLDIRDLDSDPEKIKNFERIYIIINQGMISDFIALNKKKDFIKEIENIPENWVKVKEFGENSDKKILIYYAK